MARLPRHLPAAILETLLFIVVVGTITFCGLWENSLQPTDQFYIKPFKSPTPVLDKVLAAGEITMITRNSPQCYYLYRDQAMGFEYDLAKAFANFLRVRLTVKIANDWQGMVSDLKKDPAAFIAADMMITPSRCSQAAFSDGYMTSRQYIIVNRDNRQIRHPKDLVGQTVYIRKGSAYQESLKALRSRGIDVKIVTCEDVPTEELIRRVADKKIKVTIANTNTALLNRRYFPQIAVEGPISGKTQLGWAVTPEAKGLLSQINEFFKKVKADGRFKEILGRYYANVHDFDFVDLRDYHRRLKSLLPKYQPLIQSAAKTCGFDWRLIAAQMYQESHFNPRARSNADALGLMQLTAVTAKHFGVDDPFNPKENIDAGVRHLKYLYDYFDDAKGMDRIYLALAAYNTGQGHVVDAQRLAEKMHLEPNKWADVAKTLPLLRYPKYYRHTAYGYCRGTEPVEYVKQTMLYYDILKHQDIQWYAASQPAG